MILILRDLLWNTRSWDDKIREIIIFLFLIGLLIPAKQHKSLVIFLFSAIACLQHFLQLFSGTDLIPLSYIKWIICILPIVGFWYSDKFVSFAGTYSAWSKTGKTLPKDWISHHELNVLISSICVWIMITYCIRLITYFYGNRYDSDETLTEEIPFFKNKTADFD